MPNKQLYNGDFERAPANDSNKDTIINLPINTLKYQDSWGMINQRFTKILQPQGKKVTVVNVVETVVIGPTFAVPLNIVVTIVDAPKNGPCPSCAGGRS